MSSLEALEIGGEAGRIRGFEKSSAGDKCVAAFFAAASGRFSVNPSIDLDPVGEGTLATPTIERGDFLENISAKLLSPKTWLDGHHEDKIYQFDERKGGLRWCVGV